MTGPTAQQGAASHRGYLDVAGGRIAFERAGSGFPVVLIHGFTFDLRCWDLQFTPFARQRQVIRYDVRGFGASSLPGGPYRHVDDLHALLGHLGVARADVVGLSMGGGIAVDFALAYPDRIRALIPVDATVNGVPWSDDSPLRLYAGLAREHGVAATKASWLRDPMFSWAIRSGGADTLRAMVADYSGWHWEHRDPGSAPDPPAVGRLGDIHAPTLVILGEQDVPDLRLRAELLAGEIRGAELAIIPGAGHLPNLEKSDVFNDLVLRFLARLDAEDAPGD